MARYNDVKTQMVAIIGLIGAIGTFVIILLLMVLYQGAQQRQDLVKRIDQPPLELYDMVADQEAKLNNYQWIKQVEEDGRTRDVYAIPIDRAMKRVVAEYAEGGKALPPPETAAPPAPSAPNREGGSDEEVP